MPLGIEVGVSQETISGYEIDKAVPPADMLVKLADCLNTSVDYLLGRTDIKDFKLLSKSDLSQAELELFFEFRKTNRNQKGTGNWLYQRSSRIEMRYP
ncbi:helix-turn-helix domain-containing protein [Anaerotignum propionicum]|uniref:helix-turn-helix domain-containing protein n=1 Tax=Anaerotignum propionicum TaxID=28446 RepID=UPI003B50036A